MSFELKLALKYFRARRKSLARFTSAVAVVGIAVGVASLIIAQALARGFQDEMRDKILANTAHISIFLKDSAEIADWPEIKANLQGIENVREVAPTAFENALLIGASETSYAILKVQSSGEDGNPRVSKGTENSTLILQGANVAIGARLAEKLNLKPGDAAEIVTLAGQTPTRVRVAETFATGLYEYDSTWIYVAPENYARLNGRAVFTPTVLSVSVTDIYKADETAHSVQEKLGETFRVVSWQEANRPLFAALSLERKVSLAIISLIIFIAALNITTTLALLVNERKLDIAILRTCGARTRSLILIFLLEGVLTGVSGIFFGVILGLLACLAGNYFKIVSLSAEVYSLIYIPLRPTAPNILLIILIAFVLCSVAAAYPAWRASRVKPLENLRNQ